MVSLFLFPISVYCSVGDLTDVLVFCLQGCRGCSTRGTICTTSLTFCSAAGRGCRRRCGETRRWPRLCSSPRNARRSASRRGGRRSRPRCRRCTSRRRLRRRRARRRRRRRSPRSSPAPAPVSARSRWPRSPPPRTRRGRFTSGSCGSYGCTWLLTCSSARFWPTPPTLSAPPSAS